MGLVADAAHSRAEPNRLPTRLARTAHAGYERNRPLPWHEPTVEPPNETQAGFPPNRSDAPNGRTPNETRQFGAFTCTSKG